MTLSEKLQQGKTDTEAALLASDLETWRLERLALINELLGVGGGGKVSAFSPGSTQTAATGTSWTALASGACSGLTLRNRTGTSIDFRIVADNGVTFTLEDREDVPLPCLANSNEWEIKRTDSSNTQVTVRFLRFTR